MEKRSRIAWIGDAGSGGGVPGMCRMLLSALSELDCKIDWYTRDNPDGQWIEELLQKASVKILPYPYVWDWDAWYGRNSKIAFVVSFIKRIRAYNGLVKGLVAHHRACPYDAIVQFSQAELLSLRRHALKLPLILYPCVHAAGELRWTLREDYIAKRCEPTLWRILRRFYLRYRVAIQRKDYNLVRGVIGMSRAFNRDVVADYGLASERLGVVYHPIEQNRDAAFSRLSDGTIHLLFVGRISVRKGLDLLLEIVPKLLAENPMVEVTFIGGGSLWSNYEPLMHEFPTERCVWKKSLPNAEVQQLMQMSDILLVPSQYEPGGIVIGEALANGMIVVASDAVGSAENLEEPVAFHFPTGKPDGLRGAIDGAINAVRAEGPSLRVRARAAASQFAPEKMAAQLLFEVERLVRSRAD